MMECPLVCPPVLLLYDTLLGPLILPTFLPLPLHSFIGQLTSEYTWVPSPLYALSC